MLNFTFDKDALIKDLGIEDMDDDFKKLVVERVEKLLQERVGMWIEGELSDEEVDKFVNIDDPVEMQKFLEQRFPNYKEMYQETLTDIVDHLKETIANNA